MSLIEILEELPKLTEEERERIREALDLDDEEDQAIDEGIRSLNEKPTMPALEAITKYMIDEGRVRSTAELKPVKNRLKFP